MNNATVVVTPAIVEFSNYLSTEPEDLIRFSLEYKNHVPKLLKFVKEHEDKYARLTFARMNPDCSFTKKTIYGLVKKVENGWFVFCVNESFDNVTYEDSLDVLVRTDNVLGVIPILPENDDMNPFENSPSEMTLEYFDFLEKARELMLSCVGTVHAATFYWRYSKKEPVFREGNYHIQGEITKVNKSNVEYKHFRTFAFVDKDRRYVNIIPHDEVDRFIAPDRFLRGVEISFGVSHHINPCDIE